MIKTRDELKERMRHSQWMQANPALTTDIQDTLDCYQELLEDKEKSLRATLAELASVRKELAALKPSPPLFHEGQIVIRKIDNRPFKITHVSAAAPSEHKYCLQNCGANEWNEDEIRVLTGEEKE